MQVLNTKLKVITLVMTELPGPTFQYKAIDDNGKILATRTARRTATGKTFIAALVTKNRNYKWPHSMIRLFSKFERLNTTSEDKRCRPYAIAVIEEQKAVYNEYIKELANETAVNA